MRTYVTHYFNFEYIGIYLLVSLIGLAVVIGIVLGVAKLKTRQRLQDDSLSHKAIRRINRQKEALLKVSLRWSSPAPLY